MVMSEFPDFPKRYICFPKPPFSFILACNSPMDPDFISATISRPTTLKEDKRKSANHKGRCTSNRAVAASVFSSISPVLI